MESSKGLEQREAQQGEKMIEIRIRFWTNDLAESPGNILPKQAWSSGMVIMDRNKSHGIVPKDPIPFHTLMDLTSVIEKALIAHDITLHSSRKMKKYFASDE